MLFLTDLFYNNECSPAGQDVTRLCAMSVCTHFTSLADALLTTAGQMLLL